jgi:hypothetical protein
MSQSLFIQSRPRIKIKRVFKCTGHLGTIQELGGRITDCSMRSNGRVSDEQSPRLRLLNVHTGKVHLGESPTEMHGEVTFEVHKSIENVHLSGNIVRIAYLDDFLTN